MAPLWAFHWVIFYSIILSFKLPIVDSLNVIHKIIEIIEGRIFLFIKDSVSHLMMSFDNKQKNCKENFVVKENFVKNI